MKNQKETLFYCYLYIDPSRNNEPIYVGKGKDKRVKYHLKRKDKHPFTNRLQLMKRNGVEPIIEFLCKEIDEELAFLVEAEAIAKYGRKDLGKGPLLNLTDGGEGPSGQIFTEETKQKMRKPRSEKGRAAIKKAAQERDNSYIQGICEKNRKPQSDERAAKSRESLEKARLNLNAETYLKVSKSLTGVKHEGDRLLNAKETSKKGLEAIRAMDPEVLRAKRAANKLARKGTV